MAHRSAWTVLTDSPAAIEALAWALAATSEIFADVNVYNGNPQGTRPAMSFLKLAYTVARA